MNEYQFKLFAFSPCSASLIIIRVSLLDKTIMFHYNQIRTS